MDLRKISDNQKSEYNKLVTHVMQSWEWGEFRKNMGLKVLRYGLYDGEKIFKAFQLTIHHIPFTNLNVGYLPKGSVPDEELAEALIKIGHDQNCAFIKVEPNIEMESGKWKVENYNSQFSILNSFHPLSLFLQSITS